MTVELTPQGTRGFEPPRLPRPLMNAALGLSVFLYHRLGDRMRVQGRPVLLLSTVGAKSGEVRRTLLCWFPDSATSWLVVAAGAGSTRHPAWYVNMARNPEHVAIEIGKRKLKVEPQSLKGEERADAWRRIVALAPGFGRYQEKTDRELPVIRLRAAE
jgi:deazaflavin-dependent oxidoreductase (nitroreductase family)